MDGGKGGAVVLIEVDDSLREPIFVYRVTDFSLLFILTSILVQKGAKNQIGSILGQRRNVALKTLSQIQFGQPYDKVKLNKSSFLKSRNAGGLLALLGLHSEIECYQPETQMMLAHRKGFRVEHDGSIIVPDDLTPLAIARSCAEGVLAAADEPKLSIHPTLLPVGQGSGLTL